jgi:BirA family biotin operon repressor/biotin-[acetyl-CoA-carboxylase] ligase
MVPGRIFRHGRTDSTNERAFEAIASGDFQDGDVHVAREQTHGRGRLGRSWSSAPGGLYASWIHAPAPPAPRPEALTMSAGLAVLESLRALGAGPGLHLAWPNDVFVGDAKLAGILVESRGLDPRSPVFVVGIGLNLAQTRFPGELLAERAVTSLALLGLTADTEQALELLGTGLVRAWGLAQRSPTRLFADYLAATGLAGRVVRVVFGREQLEGELIELVPERGLALLGPEGLRQLPLAHVRSVSPLP